jgi:ubiquinone/menaquinone biosynthesis C-methylase UbiE
VSIIQNKRLPSPQDEQREAWNAAAEGWNRHARLIHDWLAHATVEMMDAAKIGVGARVLDIAAGAGDQTCMIAQRVGPSGFVLATDISSAILDLAKSNAQAAGHCQVETLVLDAQDLDLHGTHFDAAVCRLGLMFCPAPLAALAQARAALKPGGHYSALVFSNPERNPCLTTTLEIARRFAGLDTPSDLKLHPEHPPGSLMSLGQESKLKDLLLVAGFTNIIVRALSVPFRLKNAQEYVDFLRQSASPLIEILSKLSPHLQDQAWLEMGKQLKAYDCESGWIGPNELLLCAAQAP